MIETIARITGAIHVVVYRATGGRIGGWLTTHVLLLTTTGRRSGKPRTAPLGYFESDGAYVITASHGGSPRQPSWYYNLKADPSASIQVGRSVMEVFAEEATGEDRDRLWARLVEVAPTYRMYASRTKRRIPMFRLRPRSARHEPG